MVSCGHADKILAAVAGIPAAADSLPIDLALYRRDDVRRVLAERDITSLYRVLKDAGVTSGRSPP